MKVSSSKSHTLISENRIVEMRLTKITNAVLIAIGVTVTQIYTANNATAADKAYSVEILSQGEGAPRPVSEETDSGLQVNRRVDIRVSADDAIEEDREPYGMGVFWMSEDPAVITPRLEVVAPDMLYVRQDGSLVEPAVFSLYTNYETFIKRWQLDVYDDKDIDRVKPFASFQGETLDSTRSISWSGFSTDDSLEAGQQLYYVLSAYDAMGRVDRTRPRKIYVGNETLREQEKLHSLERSTQHSNILATLQPAGVDTGALGAEVYGESNLDIQTIPVSGSRIRIHGTDVNPSYRVIVDGEEVPTDENGRFVVERIMPIGHHAVDVDVVTPSGNRWSRPIEFDVTGDYFFMVGIADLTVGENSVRGDAEILAHDDHYDESTFVDGRLAFYMKKKYNSKYLITAQLDTLEDDIDNMFDNIHKKDARSVLRRLDPDDYYLTYGDDSTVRDDAPSQGKFYVRMDWDANQVLWGNYNTGLTGTEYASFNRSLYGARAALNSSQTTEFGERRHHLTAFASEAQTAAAHGEFLGTGGSLYYLKHTDIVIGSEKIAIEVRDQRTERVTQRIVLQEGIDYEIDEMQGRIILTRPLSQTVGTATSGIISDGTSFSEDDVLLVVDYEYLPDGFDQGELTAGIRGKSWLTDQLGIGATYIEESEAGKEYSLKGVDATFRYHQGTFLKLEVAESEGRQVRESYLSTDGGLTDFADIDLNDEMSTGRAYSVEGRINLAEISDREGTIAAWWKRREAGFSSARSNSPDHDFTTYGVEADISVNEKVAFRARASVVDRVASKDTELDAEVDYEINNKWRVIGAISHLEEEDGGMGDIDSTLLGLRVVRSVNPDLDVYIGGQTKISGNGPDNDRIALGAVGHVNDKLSLRGEISDGDLGTSADIGAEYKRTEGHVLYGGYKLSTDRTDGRKGVATFGERASVSNQIEVFQESQYTHGDHETGLGHVFGMDFKPESDWRAGFTLQTSDLEDNAGNPVERDAVSVNFSYLPEEGLNWTGKLEYRSDESGDTIDREQWLTTNRLEYKYNDEWTFVSRANLSVTNDNLNDPTEHDARFAEVGLGVAYRPVWNDRLNFFAKYSYVYDLQSEGQVVDSAEPDERSHVVAIEGVYQIDQKWSVAGKAAYKKSKIRLDRDAGIWFSSDTKLVAARLEYHVIHDWDVFAEARWLQTGDTGVNETRSGALVGVYKHVGENLKIGVGYNFTDFNDDLTDLDLEAGGWFINLVGKY